MRVFFIWNKVQKGLTHVLDLVVWTQRNARVEIEMKKKSVKILIGRTVCHVDIVRYTPKHLRAQGEPVVVEWHGPALLHAMCDEFGLTEKIDALIIAELDS